MTCGCHLDLPECNCGLYRPAGHPLIPGQNCAPHQGKDHSWLAYLGWAFCVVCMAAVFVVAFGPGA